MASLSAANATDSVTVQGSLCSAGQQAYETGGEGDLRDALKHTICSSMLG
jgi:hypothetical protein